MVGEVMDELDEGTGLSDNEQLLEKTLRDSKARGPRVLIFSNHVHSVRVVVIWASSDGLRQIRTKGPGGRPWLLLHVDADHAFQMWKLL